MPVGRYHVDSPAHVSDYPTIHQAKGYLATFGRIDMVSSASGIFDAVLHNCAHCVALRQVSLLPVDIEIWVY